MREKNTPPPGLLLLNKRAGLTSFDSLAAVKRAFASGKVGHTGTLDKFAEGLMLVLTGKALKLSRWFTHVDKRYAGTVRFGAETDTLDPEGAVIAEAPLPQREAVQRVLAGFTGRIEQAPPEYSAIHIGGQRASALARQGMAPQMKKRPVEVFRLELTFWEPPVAGIAVHCSGGTYIRSLARDIALAAGSRAHLTALRRTAVAGFGLEEAVGGEGDLTAALRPVGPGVFTALGIPVVQVSPPVAAAVASGKPLHEAVIPEALALPAEASAAALFTGDALLAVIERRGDTGRRWAYGYVWGRG